MRKYLTLFMLVSGVIVLGLACQKEVTSPNKTDEPFDAKAAKEWYYGTFKKSPEWSSSALKGRKLPDWKNGMAKKIGDFEVVEFPLISAGTRVSVPANYGSGEQDRKRIADASLSRIVFIKNRQNDVLVREIQYIPDYDYLSAKNFDISQNALGEVDDSFSGVIAVKKWNGKPIISNILKNGKVSSRIEPVEMIPTSNQRISCTGILVTEYARTCDIDISNQGGDIIATIECTPWTPTGNTWCFDDPDAVPECSDPTSAGCFCELIGICNDPDPNGYEEEDCEARESEVYGNSVSEFESSTTTSETPTTRDKDYQWVIYKQLVDLWRVRSYEHGVHVKVNNEWRRQSLTHNNIIKSGTIIGGNISVTEISHQATVGIYNAAMTITFNVEASFVCKGSPFSSSSDFTSTLYRHVND